MFHLWNEGLNVFGQSLSGLEIIMNDINHKIMESIRTDFEFGLYRLVPELIKEAGQMRETVRREQIFDTAALRYRPLYNQLERLLSNYQFNENALFAQTMMSWASLAGFGTVHQNEDSGLVTFDENNFSIRSAQNSFLIPPSWDSYLNKKQNEIAIRVQRGLEEDKQKNIFRNNRSIKDLLIGILRLRMIISIFMHPETRYLTVSRTMQCIPIRGRRQRLRHYLLSNGEALFTHFLWNRMKDCFWMREYLYMRWVCSDSTLQLPFR